MTFSSFRSTIQLTLWSELSVYQKDISVVSTYLLNYLHIWGHKLTSYLINVSVLKLFSNESLGTYFIKILHN